MEPIAPHYIIVPFDFNAIYSDIEQWQRGPREMIVGWVAANAMKYVRPAVCTREREEERREWNGNRKGNAFVVNAAFY